MNRLALWEQLAAKNLVQGDIPDTDELRPPWYLQLLSGFLAWLAALFMTVFFVLVYNLAFDPDSIFLLGIFIIISAIVLFYQKPDSDFSVQFSLALSLSGQIITIIGLFIKFEFFEHGNTVLYLIATLQILLFFLINHPVHRGLSAFFAAITCIAIPRDLSGSGLIQTLILAQMAALWLYEFKWLKYQHLLQPLAYGLALAVILYQSISAWNLVSHNDWLTNKPHAGFNLVVLDVLHGLILLFSVVILLRRYQYKLDTPVSMAALAAVFIFSLVSIEANGLSSAILITILGFANGNRVVFGMGLLSLLVYINAYYYLLSQTLLDKSIILFYSSTLLLFCYWLIKRFLFNTGK